MGLIYKCTSPSGKSYIGLTTQGLKNRIQQHVYNSKKGSNLPFHQAIRKYGIENFNITILEDNIQDKILPEKEKYYISLYDSYYNGYNCTLGGEGTSKIQSEKIQFLWNEGSSQANISKILNVSKNTVCFHFSSLNVSKEEKEEHRIKTIKEKQKIILTQEQEDNVLNLWHKGYLLKEIKEITNISLLLIRKCLDKNNISMKERLSRGARENNKNNKIPILQYDLNNNFIKEYDSISSAAKELDLDISGLARTLKGKQKTCGKYIWKYK